MKGEAHMLRSCRINLYERTIECDARIAGVEKGGELSQKKFANENAAPVPINE
jgi:hypothetical protein